MNADIEGTGPGNSTSPAVQKTDQFLAAVDQALATGGMSIDARQLVVDDLRAQIDEMLAQHIGSDGAIPPGAVDAVLSELDPPELYSQAGQSSGEGAAGETEPAAAKPEPAPSSGEGSSAPGPRGDRPARSRYACGGGGRGWGRRAGGNAGPGAGDDESCGGDVGGGWWARRRRRRFVAEAIRKAMWQSGVSRRAGSRGPMGWALFAKLTPRARAAIAIAKREALRMNHEYVGTEHMVLGLIGEAGGVAALALSALGVDLESAREHVTRLVPPGATPVDRPFLPLTPRARQTLAMAHATAGEFGHDYVGTEHILLAAFANPDAAANRLMTSLGLSLDGVRAEVMRRMGPVTAAAATAITARARTASGPTASAYWPAGSGRVIETPGATYKVVAASADTGGVYSTIDVLLRDGDAAGAKPLPPGAYSRNDLTVCVLEGSIAVRAGDRSIEAGPGAFVRIPRGLVFAMNRTAGSPTARALLTASPGGIEDFLSEAARAGGDADALGAAAVAHGVTWDAPR